MKTERPPSSKRLLQRLAAGAAIVAALAMLSTAEAVGQDQARESGPSRHEGRFQGGIGFVTGVPVGEFADNVDGLGGVQIHFGRRLGESPVILGGDVSYLQYGSETHRLPFSDAAPDLAWDLKTTNALVLAHLRVRMQRPKGRWRPYGDAACGVNSILTQTTLSAGRVYGPSTTNLRDAGPGYGAGIGLMYGGRTKLDLGVRFVAGPEAVYLTPGAIRRQEGQVILETSRSQTSLVTLHVGAAW